MGREGGSPEYRGVAGPIRFDQNGDPVKKSFIVGVIQGGAIRLPGGRS
ncbi:MAG: hypothetical protein M3P24_01095 [Gemmatimonadota bacterium]|nr:hypothetical protein [Gemmatimonadota bacterium]